jgi:3-oxoadipate enol-lactonase
MPHVPNYEIPLYYEDIGEGLPVVLLIGLGGSSTSWLYHATRLSKQYRVICPDHRGAGRSGAPDAPYSMDIFTRDLNAIFEDAGIEKAALLGLSMGGMIAQNFYFTHPEKVSALILSSTGVGPNDPASFQPEERINRILKAHKTAGNLESFEDFISIFYHHSYLQRDPELPTKIADYLREHPQPQYAYERQLTACYTHPPYSHRIGQIDVPTLVLHGSDDLLWPIENAHYLAENIPDAELTIIEEAGHMLFAEKPDLYCDALESFLARRYAETE